MSENKHKARVKLTRTGKFILKSNTVMVVHKSHGGSERPGKLEVGGASRDSTGFGALEEGLISS